MQIFYIIGFTIVSLDSFYFYNLGIQLFSYLSLIIMSSSVVISMVHRNAEVSRITFFVLIGFIFIYIWSLVGIVVRGIDPDIKRLFLPLPWILGTIVASHIFTRVPQDKVIFWYLSVHASFFWVQFLLFHLFGIYIDYVVHFTGEAQRMFGGSFESIFESFIRVAGLYTEPGTYCTFIAAFVALFSRWYKESSRYKFVFFASLLSLGFSFSLFGIVFCVLILLTVKEISIIWRWLLLVVTYFVVNSYLEQRFSLMDENAIGTGFRIQFLLNSFQYLTEDVFNFFTGLNLIAFNPDPGIEYSYNDTGLFFYFLYFAGVPLTILVILPLILRAFHIDRASVVALTIVLISKITVTGPFFPFVIISIVWHDRVFRVINCKKSTNNNLGNQCLIT